MRRRLAASLRSGVFGFLGLKALKASGWNPFCVSGTRHFFSFLLETRSVSLRLPAFQAGDNKIQTTLCCLDFVLLGAAGNPLRTLFLTNEDVDRCAAEIPLLPDLVLKETLVGILNVLRQVCKEYECGYLRTLQLCAVLYLDVLTLG